MMMISAMMLVIGRRQRLSTSHLALLWIKVQIKMLLVVGE